MVQVEFAASDAATALTPGAHPGRLQPARGRRDRRVGRPQARGRRRHPPGGAPRRRARTPTTTTPRSSSAARASRASAATTPARPSTDVRPAVALVPSDAAAVGAAYPWLDYTGRWGQRETSFYNGPTGPNTKDQWTAPLTWTDDGGRLPPRTPCRPAACSAPRRPARSAASSPPARTLLRLAMNNLAVRGRWRLRRARPRRRVAGPPHDLAALRPAAPGPPPQHRSGRRGGVADVPAAGSCSSSGSALPIAVATLLPGIATVWITSAAESLRRRPRRCTACVVAVAGLVLVAAVAGDALARAGGRDGRRPRDRRGPAGRARGAPTRGALRRAVPLLLTQAGHRRRPGRCCAAHRACCIPVAARRARAQPARSPRSCCSRGSRGGGRAPQRAPRAPPLGQGRRPRRPDQRARARRRAGARHRRSSSAPRCRSR